MTSIDFLNKVHKSLDSQEYSLSYSPAKSKNYMLYCNGSSIELSADGPIRPPYAVYFQGGLTWVHAKLGILMSLQKMVEAGLVNL